MADVTLKNIYKSYDKTEVVKDVSLDIKDGEFVVLVGPSGCGKTTTLRMVAGLESITNGDLFIAGKRVNDLPPKDRNIAMVFQNYALYAHMSVYNNIAFGLRLRKTSKSEIERRVKEAAEIVGMTDYLDRKPKALSGGQRQRVALARAIVRKPGVFLFDEPLSNLDAKLRVQMRMEIARLQRTLKTTTLYVTHDQIEAMTMADRIAVLDNGVLQQIGEPMDLYDRPANTFVAGFIGSPGMNFVAGSIDRSGTFTSISGGVSFRVPDGLAAAEVIIGIRPEGIGLQEASGTSGVKGVVQTVERMGNESIIYFKNSDQQFTARVSATVNLSGGDAASFFIHREKLHFFDSQTGDRVKV